MSIHKGVRMRIFAEQAWQGGGWQKQLALTIEDGLIASIENDALKQPDDVVVDTLLPALANLHSHSFQRAMAGMTEFRAAGQESFWTWRTLMYKFLNHLTPEHVEAIASLVFLEMQEAGYASVGEFHYVHHQIGGSRYEDRAELTNRIFAAAELTGIGLTHLPVLYSYGGPKALELSGGQQRFGNTVDEYSELVEDVVQKASNSFVDAQVGIAPHSLRATTPRDMATLLEYFPNVPVHIHIAEQPKEVTDIHAWLGARPVDWLLANHDVGENWCLIHATHMTDGETSDVAKSGAVVGLCPITEANLGDGPFNGPQYLASKGRFGVGSDSNVRISLVEELRTLEYSQRLRDLSRNVMVKTEGSVGKTLYLGAAKGGAQALNRRAGEITTGYLADLVAIDSTHQHLCGLTVEQIFDGVCFAADDSIVSDVWCGGRHVVQGGQHILREQILRNYRTAMNDLTKRLSV